MTTFFNPFKSAMLISVGALLTFSACNKDTEIEPKPVIKQDFQLAFANGSGSNSSTYLQGKTDLSIGEISFEGKGYQMPSARTARIFVSSEGSEVYSLNYTVGTIDKFLYNGGDNYTHVTQFDASIPLGVKAVRFTKLNDNAASVHNISAVAQYDSLNGMTYLGHQMTVSIGILNLKDMNFGDNFNKAIDLQLPASLKAEGYYVSRIDCPVISNGKIYYGAATSKFNASTGKAEATDKAFSLVLDYPSLKNPTVINTDLVKGATNGYRTPTQYVDEAGDILQMVSNGKELNIVKIKSGNYDASYKFDISSALGRDASSNGWFYVGKGIGYMPYEKVNEEKVQIGVNPSGEPTYSSAWGLLRIDLNSQTVVDLVTPKGLWLQQYQTSVARDGKFYIAFAPVGEQGYIHIFDINSTNPEGTKGAKITSGADQYYIGIY
ncbi:MAG: hypothetical protein M9958_02370 [Chitinophagales bacterium]|nr:hypothetical protein [Chitinophagales bacterium]